MNDRPKIKVVIASEFSIFRKGVALLLEKEKQFVVAGEATGVNDIFKTVKESSADILIINLNVPIESINSLCQNIFEKFPKLPILLFMEQSFEFSVADLIISGVRGIIWKENSEDEFTQAIKSVAAGRSFFEDPQNCRINCHFSHRNCEVGDQEKADSILTEREIEVLRLISSGFTYKEIAARLNISSRTVEAHKNHMITKLDLSNKNELVVYALENLKN